MSAGVTVQTTTCSTATDATRPSGVTAIAARRCSDRWISAARAGGTDRVRCITRKPLQANYDAVLAQGGQYGWLRWQRFICRSCQVATGPKATIETCTELRA